MITPTLVNNFVGSILWYQAQFGVADFAKIVPTMPEGISLGDGGANGGGFPTMSGGPERFPNGRNVGHGQLSDDLAWTKGRHTIKAGIAFRYDKYTYTQHRLRRLPRRLQPERRGGFRQRQATELHGEPSLGSSFSQTYPLYGALHFRVPSIDFYVSDEWAVAKNIKLTYGLRFELDMKPTCIETCFVLTNVPFDSSSYQGGASIPYNATLMKQSNVFYNGEGVIPQPRIGIAWKPFGDKTVIRTGFGMFSTNYTDGTLGTFANQVPNKFQPSGLTFGDIGLAADGSS